MSVYKLYINSLIFSVFLLLCINSKGQLSEGGIPQGYISNFRLTNKVFLNKPEQLNSAKYVPSNRDEFAKLIQVNLSPENDGDWYQTSDYQVWTLVIKAEDATSLNFTFAPFKLQTRARVFVYDADKTQLIGAFTEQNNKKAGILPVKPLAGNEIIIELNLPTGVDYNSELGIRQIGYGYRGIFSNLQKRSGECEVNINCPEGDEWQDEKRAVAKLVINNNMLCTGAMINNTKKDGHPYLLTASHCIDQWAEAENSVFIFNYESVNCDGTDIFDGQSIAVSELVATGSSKQDFTLVELSEMPPEEFDPYYLGWNRSSEPPESSTTIHHPDGDIKKISHDYGAAVIGNFGDSYDHNSHWQILHWDIGTTEGGSSGAPLLDQNHYLIGDLTGGEADCISPVNDFYSRFDLAWDTYGDDDMYHLKKWLDPLNSGAVTLEGFSPYATKLERDISLLDILEPQERICNKTTIIPQLKFRNRGMETIQNLEFDVYINDEIIESISWRGELLSQTTEIFDLDGIDVDFGEYELKIVSRNPNGLPDENVNNDTVYHSFKVMNGSEIRLDLTTDEYAQETSWELVNSDNDIIYRSRFYVNSTKYSENFCLADGCYVFTIYDSEGDGICCDYGNGDLQLYNPATGETFLGGGAFGNQLRDTICLYPDYYKTVDDQLEFVVYPNPASDIIQLELFQNPGVKIRLVDYSGKVRTEMETVKGRAQIPVSHLPQGIYLLQFYSDKHIYSEKIIITR